ncbi:uncharacterized protein BDV14DRAFT_196338 [Aspergillus stella-maris]|uniref:uncharacterized protein n=1 Tax=Aspergillus stella-maris TaxID=1810926 RepID=UPI003CCCD4DD
MATQPRNNMPDETWFESHHGIDGPLAGAGGRKQQAFFIHGKTNTVKKQCRTEPTSDTKVAASHAIGIGMDSSQYAQTMAAPAPVAVSASAPAPATAAPKPMTTASAAFTNFYHAAPVESALVANPDHARRQYQQEMEELEAEIAGFKLNIAEAEYAGNKIKVNQ